MAKTGSSLPQWQISTLNWPKKKHTHSLTAKIGTNAGWAAARFIKFSRKAAKAWKSNKKYRFSSILGRSQLFNDRSKVSLSAGLIQFHCLQAAVLHFSEDNCSARNWDEWSVVAYLLACFEAQNFVRSANAVSVYYSASCSKLDSMEALPDFIDHYLVLLANVVVSGLFTIFANVYKLQLYPFLYSYDADAHENEGQLSE